MSAPAGRTAAALAMCSFLPTVLLAATIPPQEPGAKGADQNAPAGVAPTSLRPFKSPPALVRGQLKSRYYLRWTGDDSDNDLVETLSVDVGDAERHAITGHLMGRLAYDMDGRDDTFASINDSYGHQLDALVYDAYVDVHRIDGLSLVRVGRQSVYETPEIAYFDGAHVASAEFGPLAFQAGGYVGSSTHLYESSKSGDLTAGGYLQTRPWDRGRLRVDYMHLEDETRLRSHDDDLLGAGFWQSIGTALQFDAQYSRIADRDRDARGRAVYRQSDWGTLVQLSYYTLLRTQGDLVLEADPFFNSLNELRPYDQWSLLAAQDITRSLHLQAAADLRRVDDAADIGFYNRDYDRYYGTATVDDIGLAGLRLSGTLDFWDSNGQLVRSWGGDASYETASSTFSLGSYYSLYKFDLFSNSERDHVRTYYLKLRHKANKAFTIEGNYELEDDDFDQYQRLRLGVTWNF